MAEEKTHPKLIPPPVSDDWRPKHKSSHKKPYGVIGFYKPFRFWMWNRGNLVQEPEKLKLREIVSWYATERARLDAIEALNKKVDDKYSPVLAIAKIER